MLLVLLAMTACRNKDFIPVETGGADSGLPAADVDEDGDGALAEDDCDDQDASAFPGNDEGCDQVDNDCDGAVDEGLDQTWFQDDDGDGFGSDTTTEACARPDGFAEQAGDCDDADALVNADADEVCNGIDDDCDGDADSDAIDAPTWAVDADGDGYGGTAFTYVQCEAPSGTVDNTDDCDDLDADVNPDGVEVCNELDDDCNGAVDDAAADAETWYADTDEDGFGDPDNTTASCDQPSGYLADDTDCDDTDSAVYPDAPEVPADGTDQSCDGIDGCDDLDCDGVPELVLGQYYTGTSHGGNSYIYTQSGGAYDDTNRTGMSTTGVLDAHAEDLDQDGYVDLVYGTYYSPTDGYSGDSLVYWGTATGYSGADMTELDTSGVWDLLAEDLDGDGYTDLVFGSWYDGSYSTYSDVFYGSATGYDSSNMESIATYSVTSVASGDVNGDGYTDLFFCSYYANSVVAYGSATGFTASELSTTYCYDAEISDLNADGYDDVVMGRYGTLSYIFWGTSSGVSGAYVDSLPAGYNYGVAISDLDSDGYDDVVFGGYNGGTYVYFNSSVGFSSSVYTKLSATGCWKPQARDLDSDGYPDLVCPIYYAGDYYTESQIFWGSSSGPDDGDVDRVDTEGPTEVSIGDLDGDGYPELVFNGHYVGTYTARSFVYWGSSTGYSSSAVDTLDPSGSTYAPILLVGDTDW